MREAAERAEQEAKEREASRGPALLLSEEELAELRQKLARALEDEDFVLFKELKLKIAAGEKAAKEEAKSDARKRAREYLETEGNDWATKLQQGVSGARFAATGGSDAPDLPVGLVTAAELQRQREDDEQAAVEARAAAARQRVEATWAEAEAKKAAAEAEAKRKNERKKKKKAERAAQQKSLSFSLDDEDD